jgi:hypothetical protein
MLTQAVLDEFASTDLARACATPDGAYANCLAVSVAFAVWLREHGIPCGLLRMAGSAQPFAAASGRWPFCDPAVFAHWTVSVGGASVDWSARQFDPAAAWPQVLPVAELASRWREVEPWACERCPELVADRRHVELAPVWLAERHRALASATAGRGPFADPRHDGTAVLVPMCACGPA